MAREVVVEYGSRLGDYIVGNRISAGSMGSVYRGVHAPTQRLVALKFPHRLSDADMPGYIRRFQTEARLAIELAHPNIVKVYEVASVGEHDFMVMEFVEGRTLYDVLERTRSLPVATAADLTMQIARALEEIHALGVVHRDIKPANIMVDSSGRARLLDFGVAKMRIRERDAAAETGEIVGTPFYIPPEQSQGRRADHRADIYSLGVTLFRMVAGRVPYLAERRDELFRMILEAPIPSPRDFNPEVPEAIEQVIRRAIAKDPEHRHPTASELIADLTGLIDATDLFD